MKNNFKKIAEKYNLPYKKDKQTTALLSFATVFEALLKKAKKKDPQYFKILKEKDKLTVLDIGCGYFRYGPPLNAILQTINPNIKLFAIDKKKFFRSSHYEPATFIKGDITKINLKKHGIGEIDIIAIFNPWPGLPDLGNIPKEIRKKAIFLGCVDWNKELFIKTLKENGYTPTLWQDNICWEDMREWWNNYDPFVFAKLK